MTPTVGVLIAWRLTPVCSVNLHRLISGDALARGFDKPSWRRSPHPLHPEHVDARLPRHYAAAGQRTRKSTRPGDVARIWLRSAQMRRVRTRPAGGSGPRPRGGPA